MRHVKTTLLIVIVALTFISCTSRSNYVSEIEEILVANKDEIQNVFIDFSKSNEHINAISISETDGRITILLDSKLRQDLNIQKTHLLFKNSDELQNSRLTIIYSELADVVELMQKLQIGNFAGKKGKVRMNFDGFGFKYSGVYAINHDYHYVAGLRTKDEMVSLFEDKDSRYWIYEIDDDWMIISNP